MVDDEQVIQLSLNTKLLFDLIECDDKQFLELLELFPKLKGVIDVFLETS